MTTPNIADILKIAIDQKLPVKVRYIGTDDQSWFGPMTIDRDKAAELCLKAAAINITFFLPE